MGDLNHIHLLSPMMLTIALFIALLQVTHSFGLLPVAARGSRWRLGCSLDDAAAKAKKIVGIEEHSDELVLRLALELLASEYEKKLLEKENRMNLVEAYFEKELSFVVQRAALEALFREVLEILCDTEELKALKDHLGELTFQNLGIQYALKRPVTMTGINRILVNSKARHWLFQKIGCPCASNFPVFDDLLLYGIVSDIVHRPSHKTILVSNKVDDTTKRFWQCMAEWKAKPFKEIDDVEAAGGEDIANGQHQQAQ